MAKVLSLPSLLKPLPFAFEARVARMSVSKSINAQCALLAVPSIWVSAGLLANHSAHRFLAAMARCPALSTLVGTDELRLELAATAFAWLRKSLILTFLGAQGSRSSAVVLKKH